MKFALIVAVLATLLLSAAWAEGYTSDDLEQDWWFCAHPDGLCFTSYAECVPASPSGKCTIAKHAYTFLGWDEGDGAAWVFATKEAAMCEILRGAATRGKGGRVSKCAKMTPEKPRRIMNRLLLNKLLGVGAKASQPAKRN
jgi:hypothetical protein